MMLSYDKKYLTWTFVVLCFGCSLICGEQHDFQFDSGDDAFKVSFFFSKLLKKNSGNPFSIPSQLFVMHIAWQVIDYFIDF